MMKEGSRSGSIPLISGSRRQITNGLGSATLVTAIYISLVSHMSSFYLLPSLFVNFPRKEIDNHRILIELVIIM
jgi:hypothetical protein